MKYSLLCLIRIYWFLIPESKRRNCLYNISCSNHIYNTTEKDGLRKGLIEFKYRYKTCRPGYEIVLLQSENTLLMKLVNGTVLNEKEISEEIVKNYKAI
jgi:putative component of membrane protein insertase Oxa1/YidC/SpoIIIJ protein YidD